MGFSSAISLRGSAGSPGQNFLVGTAVPPGGGTFGNPGDTYLQLGPRILYRNSGGDWSTFAQAYNIITTGSAVPGVNYGSETDIYLRIDGSGITTLYQKSGGAWALLATLTGAAGSNATLPNDFTANSLAIGPISGDSAAVALTLSSANGKVFGVDASGNTSVLGNFTASGTTSVASLNASGTSNLAAVNATNIAASGTLTASGNTTLQNLVVNGTSQFASVSTGTVSGTGLQISGTGSISGATTTGALTASSLSTSGASSLAAVQATSATVSGALIAQSLAVTLPSSGAASTPIALKTSGGTTVLSSDGSGNLTTANHAAQNLSASGTLAVSGASTLAQTTIASLSVTGTSTLAGVTAGAITCSSLTNQGNGAVTGTFSAAALALTLPSSGAATSPILLKSNAGATLLSVDQSGNAILNNLNAANISASGTLNITGASTLAAVNAAAINCTSLVNTGSESAASLAITLPSSGAAALPIQLKSSSGATLLSADTSGNLTAAAISGSNVSASGTLAVTGSSSVAGLTSSGLVQAKSVTLTSGGGGQLTFADGTTLATAPSGSQIAYALGSNAVTLGPICQLNAATISSTPTIMNTQGVAAPQDYYPPNLSGYTSALMGVYLVTGANSVAGTFELYDLTAGKSIYTASVAANSTGGIGTAVSTSTYPMTPGNRHVWRVTGSGSFTGYAQPYYLTPSDNAYGTTTLAPFQISGTALSTSTQTSIFMPGGTATNGLYAAFRCVKPSFVQQVAITVVGSGTSVTSFRCVQSGTSTVAYTATPTANGSAGGTTTIVGPYQANTSPTTFPANTGYYCQILGTGTPTAVNIIMTLVG